MDQVSLPHQEPVHVVAEIASYLYHPQSIRLGCDAGDLHAPRRQVDQKQHEVPCQSLPRPYLDREEVRRNEHLPMSMQKLLPRSLPVTLWCWLQTVCLENVRDRATRHLMAEIGQRALYPAIAPIPVLSGHTDHQILDPFLGPGSSGAALLAAVVFPGNQLPVPSLKRFGRDDGCQLSKNPSAELLGFGCQASALVVAEAKPFVSQLLPQNPIFLLKIVNDVALLLTQPPCDRNE